MSFKEPIPALSNVMDTNEHASTIRKRGARAGCGVGLYRPVTGALSSPDRAPSPTCPFIKNRRCQRADQHQRRTTNRSPIYTGGPVVRSVLATEEVGAGKTGSTASVSGHICAVLDSVNAFLQFCCVRRRTPQKSAISYVVMGVRSSTPGPLRHPAALKPNLIGRWLIPRAWMPIAPQPRAHRCVTR